MIEKLLQAHGVFEEEDSYLQLLVPTREKEKMENDSGYRFKNTMEEKNHSTSSNICALVVVKAVSAF